MLQNTPYLFLMPLVPLIGALINGCFGLKLQQRAGKGAVHAIAVGASVATFVLALVAFFSMRGSETILYQRLWDWIPLHGEGARLKLDLAFQIDRLSAVMMLIITGVGSLIHIFSVGYMQDEKPYWRYFAWLNLFLGMMIVLVLGDSFWAAFVGWEGVGLASYLLIGFYYEEVEKAQAGLKAFLVNRVGDFSFTAGVAILFWALGGTYSDMAAGGYSLDDGGGFFSLTFRTIEARMRDPHFAELLLTKELWGMQVVTLAPILIFFGAAAKSAQIPLYVWLPDAMAGPTPVSALMHAATMVTAGVYLMVRLNFIVSLSPVVMTVIAVIGTATAFFAALMALFQTDLKKVLAYSTVSQLGYMFMGVGAGAFSAAIFHLMTHAFFKACLFLGSGAIIYAMHHRQEMKDMGGLKKILPVTYWTFLLSALAISGVPPFSGFWSKDEILWKMYDSANLLVPGELLWFFGALAAVGTAFYMFRLVYQTFSGEPRADHHTLEHAREYRSMSGPLVVLGALAVLGGLIGLPHFITHTESPFERWLTPVVSSAQVHTHWKTELAHGMEGDRHALEEAEAELTALGPEPEGAEAATAARLAYLTRGLEEKIAGAEGRDVGFTFLHSHAGEWVLLLVSILLALMGIGGATLLYRNKYRSPEEEARLYGAGFHKLLFNKFYVDEIYHRFIVQNAHRLFRASALIDRYIIDGVVNLSAYVLKVAAWSIGSLDTHLVDGAVNGIASLTRKASSELRLLQTGRVQNYVMGIAAGATVLILVAYLF